MCTTMEGFWRTLGLTLSHIDAEVVNLLPQTDLNILVPAVASRCHSRLEQQRLHGIHTCSDGTSSVGVLSPHAQLRFCVSVKVKERLGFWHGKVVVPLAPSHTHIYIEHTNILSPCNPISNSNPSWINIIWALIQIVMMTSRSYHQQFRTCT